MASRERRNAHIDDPSRVKIGFTLFTAPICGSSKERQTFLGESEHSVKVQRQDFCPSLVLRVPPSKFNHRREKGDSDVERTG